MKEQGNQTEGEKKRSNYLFKVVSRGRRTWRKLQKFIVDFRWFRFTRKKPFKRLAHKESFVFRKFGRG